MKRLLIFLAPALLSAQNPAAIEHHLRFTVRLAGQPDSALDLLDRMRSYHIPGMSVAIIDNYRVVYAKGFGVTKCGVTRQFASSTRFPAGPPRTPLFTSGFLRLVEDKK